MDKTPGQALKKTLTPLRIANTILNIHFCVKAFVYLANTCECLSQGVAMASIIVMTGAQKGNYYPLGHRTNVAGRDEGLLIQILDEHISRIQVFPMY